MQSPFPRCRPEFARFAIPRGCRTQALTKSFILRKPLISAASSSMTRQDILDRLKTCGVLPTPQRLEIAEILLAKPQHLAADQIIDELRRNGRRVSKATVYNTLKLFSDFGLVRELHVADSRRFYDSTTHPHHHFFDIDSGELTDIPADQVRIAGLPALPPGTEQESVEVLIRVRSRKSPADR